MEDKKADKARVQDTRNAEKRDKELRAILNMKYQDPLFVPPEIIPDGMEYYWVRESYMGQVDTFRMVEMKRKGWSPVPAERHPELVFEDFFGNLSHVKGYIYQKGLILCERPIEYGKIEREQIDRTNYEIMTSMPGTENFLGEPTMPGTSHGHTYLSKGIPVGPDKGGFGR